MSFYQAGNYQLALRACDRALEANQFWGHYSASIGWANRGKVTQAMGLYDESLQAYNRRSLVITIIPSFGQTMVLFSTN